MKQYYNKRNTIVALSNVRVTRSRSSTQCLVCEMSSSDTGISLCPAIQQLTLEIYRLTSLIKKEVERRICMDVNNVSMHH